MLSSSTSAPPSRPEETTPKEKTRREPIPKMRISAKSSLLPYFIGAMFLSICCGAVMESISDADVGTLLVRNGVYFRQGALVAIGESHWKIVTDIETIKVRDQISTVESPKSPRNDLQSQQAFSSPTRTHGRKYSATIHVPKPISRTLFSANRCIRRRGTSKKKPVGRNRRNHEMVFQFGYHRRRNQT